MCIRDSNPDCAVGLLFWEMQQLLAVVARCRELGIDLPDIPLRNPDDYGRDFDRLLALYRAATGDDTDGLLPCRDNFASE